MNEVDKLQKMRQNGDIERRKAELDLPQDEDIDMPGPPYSWQELEDHLRDLADYESGEMKSRPQSPPIDGKQAPWHYFTAHEGDEPWAEPPTRYEFFHGMMEWGKERTVSEPPNMCELCGTPTVSIWWFNAELCWAPPLHNGRFITGLP